MKTQTQTPPLQFGWLGNMRGPKGRRHERQIVTAPKPGFPSAVQGFQEGGLPPRPVGIGAVSPQSFSPVPVGPINPRLSPAYRQATMGHRPWFDVMARHRGIPAFQQGTGGRGVHFIPPPLPDTGGYDPTIGIAPATIGITPVDPVTNAFLAAFPNLANYPVPVDPGSNRPRPIAPPPPGGFGGPPPVTVPPPFVVPPGGGGVEGGIPPGGRKLNKGGVMGFQGGAAVSDADAALWEAIKKRRQQQQQQVQQIQGMYQLPGKKKPGYWTSQDVKKQQDAAQAIYNKFRYGVFTDKPIRPAIAVPQSTGPTVPASPASPEGQPAAPSDVNDAVILPGPDESSATGDATGYAGALQTGIGYVEPMPRQRPRQAPRFQSGGVGSALDALGVDERKKMIKRFGNRQKAEAYLRRKSADATQYVAGYVGGRGGEDGNLRQEVGPLGSGSVELATVEGRLPYGAFPRQAPGQFLTRYFGTTPPGGTTSQIPTSWRNISGTGWVPRAGFVANPKHPAEWHLAHSPHGFGNRERIAQELEANPGSVFGAGGLSDVPYFPDSSGSVLIGSETTQPGGWLGPGQGGSIMGWPSTQGQIPAEIRVQDFQEGAGGVDLWNPEPPDFDPDYDYYETTDPGYGYPYFVHPQTTISGGPMLAQNGAVTTPYQWMQAMRTRPRQIGSGAVPYYGYGQGDKIPAMLSEGEAVFNPRQLAGLSISDPKLLRQDQVQAIRRAKS